MASKEKTQVEKFDLPQEIIISILSKLHVKFLFQFKCVSKEWFKLISSSGPGSVKQKHDMIMDQNPYLVVWNTGCLDVSKERNYWPFVDEETIRFSVIDMFEEKLQNRFELQLPRARDSSVTVCHGLCLMNFVNNYVLNPSTREIVKLPPLQGNRHEAASTGFGYLANKNEYKIVAWCCDKDPESSSDSEDKMECQILTLTDGGRIKAGTWRVGPRRPIMGLSSPLCINGLIYWLNWSRCERTQHEEYTCTMVLFDLEKEECELRQCPELPLGSAGELDLVEFEGCSCIGIFFHKKSTMKLWKFKDDKWEIKYIIKFPSHITNKNIRHLHVSLVAYISKGDDDDEELIFMIKGVSDGLVYYNTTSRSYRRSKTLPQFVSRGGSHYAKPFLYFDSLFSLDV